MISDSWSATQKTLGCQFFKSKSINLCSSYNYFRFNFENFVISIIRKLLNPPEPKSDQFWIWKKRIDWDPQLIIIRTLVLGISLEKNWLHSSAIVENKRFSVSSLKESNKLEIIIISMDKIIYNWILCIRHSFSQIVLQSRFPLIYGQLPRAEMKISYICTEKGLIKFVT